MKRNNLLDANEQIGSPPSKADQMREHEKVMETVNAITPDAKQKRQLDEIGLGDIV